MSPPKLALPSKPQSESQVLPAEEKDKLNMASIAIETLEAKHFNMQVLRAYRLQQQYRRLMCVIAVVLITMITVITILSTMDINERNKYRQILNCQYGMPGVNEHVRVDHTNRLIYASRRPRSWQTDVLYLQVLHEYDRRLIAYKDEDNNVCYIDRLDETFQDGYARWLSYEKYGHPGGKMLARVSEEPIEKEVLRHVGDIHIYAHCENATSYWFMEVHGKVESSALTVHL